MKGSAKHHSFSGSQSDSCASVAAVSMSSEREFSLVSAVCKYPSWFNAVHHWGTCT